MNLETRLAILALSCLFALPASAADPVKMYVVDEMIFSLRGDKQPGAALVGRVKTSQMVNVTRTDGEWSQIKLEDGTTGWLQSRFLTNEPPISLQSRQALAQNQTLASRLDALQKENAKLQEQTQSLAAALKEKESALEKSESERRRQVQESADYAGLKSRYEQSRKELATLKAEVDSLTAASDEASNQRRLKWLLAGGGVLLAGWLAGMISGRRKRHGPRLY